MSDSTFHYRGFDVPIADSLVTGGGPDNFSEVADFHIAELQRVIGIAPDDSIVEIGCGIGRDAIPLIDLLPNGKYHGVDITPSSISWCQREITGRHPNFSFQLFDIANDLYSPSGVKNLTDCRISASDQSIDLIFGESVFTHLFPEEIEFYLKEFKRVLKPSGKVLQTCFIVDDFLRDHLAATDAWLKFPHLQPGGFFQASNDIPRQAVGYRADHFRALVRNSGLRMARDFLYGSWSGYRSHPESSQDAVLLSV